MGEDLQTRTEDLLKTREITVTRIKNGKTEELSAGKFLHDLTYHDGVLEMLLGSTSEGYLRPSEVLIFGLGLSPSQALPLIYKRTGQFLYRGVHKVDPLEMV